MCRARCAPSCANAAPRPPWQPSSPTLSGYNDVVLDMGSIALEKGVEYQLYFAASNNFYPPSVQPSWVAANDCIDIAHGSAYYGDDTTLIFSGTVVLQET